MNKLCLALLGATMFSATTINAYAQDRPFGKMKPYVALDAQYLSGDIASGTGLEEEYGAINIGLGIRPHKNIGFEVGYFASGERETSLAGVDSSIDGFSADVIGYLPISKDEKFELFGSAGLAVTSYEVSTGTIAVSDSETKPRFGFGAQYHMNENWSARARFIYTDAKVGGDVDSYSSFGVGLAYKF